MGPFSTVFVSDKYPPVDSSFHLRALGNLTYREFIALLKKLWEEAHPDIPVLPNSPNAYTDSNRGTIIYGLELRKPMTNEPKLRHREEIHGSDGSAHIMRAQRFQNVVSFTAIHKNPDTCEAIIEEFEDWMLFEAIPVLKELGASDILYSRRLPDGEYNRSGEDTCHRTVSFMITLEKIRHIEIDKIRSILINARVWLDSFRTDDSDDFEDATPVRVIIEDQQATPNF